MWREEVNTRDGLQRAKRRVWPQEEGGAGGRMLPTGFMKVWVTGPSPSGFQQVCGRAEQQCGCSSVPEMPPKSGWMLVEVSMAAAGSRCLLHQKAQEKAWPSGAYCIQREEKENFLYFLSSYLA